MTQDISPAAQESTSPVLGHKPVDILGKKVWFPEEMTNAQITEAINKGVIPQLTKSVANTPIEDTAEPSTDTSFSAQFSKHLKHPWDAVTQDSIVVHLANWATGNTALDRVTAAQKIVNHPDAIGTPEHAKALQTIEEFGHLLQEPPDNKGITETVSMLWKAGKTNPGMITAELANAVMADPWLLFPWFWQGIPVRAGLAVTKAMGKVAGTVAKVGTRAGIGAGEGAAIHTALQLGERGEVDVESLGPSMFIGAMLNTSMGGVADSIISMASRKTKIAEKVFIERIKQNPYRNPMEILEEVAKEANVASAKVIASLQPEALRIYQKAFLKEINKIWKKQRAERKTLTTDEAARKSTFQGRTFEEVIEKNNAALDKLTTEELKKAGIDLSRSKTRSNIIATAGGLTAGAAAIALDDQDITAAASIALTGAVGIKVLQKIATHSTKHLADPLKIVPEQDAHRVVEAGQALLAARNLDIERFGGQIRLVLGEGAQGKAYESLVTRLIESQRKMTADDLIGSDRNLTRQDQSTRVKEIDAVRIRVKEYLDDAYTILNKRGMVDTHHAGFVPHILKEQRFKERGLGEYKFDKDRTILGTLADVQKKGYTPISTEISQLIQLYGQSINKALINKDMIQVLQKQKVSGLSGSKPGEDLTLILTKQPTGTASNHYIYSPALEGLAGKWVHKEAIDSLSFMLNATDVSGFTRGAESLNFLMKRGKVALSFFHASALVESMIYAGAIRDVPSVVLGKGGFGLAQLKYGGYGDIVETALMAGLKIGGPEDVGIDVFYRTLNTIQTTLEQNLPSIIGKPAGLAVKGYGKINKVVDHIMWDKILNGGKLIVFMKEYERALLRHPTRPANIIAKETAEFVNDAFGNLNWQQIALGTSNRLLRKIASKMMNPKGRRGLQLLFFAPDWTLANIRILGKALPFINKSPVSRRMYQMYAARAALLYATLGNGINYMFTGKPIWDNKDPLKINLGDGRTMEWSKQFREPFEWVFDFPSELTNKSSSLIKLGGAQLLNKKYLNAKGAPPLFDAEYDSLPTRMKKRGKNVVSQFLPIWMQATLRDGEIRPDEMLSSFLGHAIRPDLQSNKFSKPWTRPELPEDLQWGSLEGAALPPEEGPLGQVPEWLYNTENPLKW